MEVISIDLEGKFAHFRKFYSNNTALSYFLPPRTTVIGMLAALLGKEKESYYEGLSSDKIRIGIKINSSLKKSFHRCNLLMIKGPNDFRGKAGIVQTPFELVSGKDIKEDLVKYRIYISYFKEGEKTFNEVKNSILNQSFHYNLSFGTANFTAFVAKYRLFSSSEVKMVEDSVQLNEIHSAICSENIDKINFSKAQELVLDEELIPADFEKNNYRGLSKTKKILYSINCKPISVKLKTPFIRLQHGNQIENITFIE